jgi:glycosyltransferase involved in cell wall biosynthesis
VPVGDAGRLAAAIAQLVRSPEQREHLGRRGRARIERSFRQQDVVRRMSEFYEAAGLKLRPIAVRSQDAIGSDK